jgi:formylglycine-generating enzyme required for sulfatase activity
VYRGGGWSSNAFISRVAYRHDGYFPTGTISLIGFRVLRSLAP